MKFSKRCRLLVKLVVLAVTVMQLKVCLAAVPSLQVRGVDLVDDHGNTVILHGMSTHGMQWFGNFATPGAFQYLKGRGANLIRLAMYTGEGGYIANPALKNTVFAAADAALQQNLYVIIDWHILQDGNPQLYKQQAKQFFAEAAGRYGNNPGVIYEICNEPNGNVSWQRDIKPYAEEVIPVIRTAAPHSVVLVGTPTWSQDVDVAAADPLSFANVMYVCHFYAGTHGQDLRNKIDAARSKGVGVFISEWGTSRADGSNGVFLDNAAQWLDFLAQRQMSWANWSLCDKNESSAALLPSTGTNGNWTDESLSPSGRFVFSKF